MPLIYRQTLDDDVVVPAHYGGWSPLGPGAIVGVTLGAVVGFLIILWMIYTCINFGRPVENSSSSVYTGTATSVLSVRSRSRHHHHRNHRSPPRGPRIIATEEVRVKERESVSRSRPPGPIIVDAEPPMQQRRVSRGPPPPRIVPDESDEEEIVVIEEHTPERRRSRPHSSSRRHSRHESRRRRSRDY